MTDLCAKLYRDSNHECWNEFDLAELPRKDLQFLCLIMGIPAYQSKEEMIVRLLATRIVRRELARFGDDPQEVVDAFKRDRLRWMCEQNCLWKSGNKYALSVCLLRWRNDCRQKGQEFLQKCIDAFKESPKQLVFKL